MIRTFRDAIQSRGFIGQERIIDELTIMSDAFELGDNANLLLLASSGHGKTTLAETFLRVINPPLDNCLKYYPEKDEPLKLNLDKRFHFIDEVHWLTRPEPIYEHLDSGLYTFVLATNFFDRLLEPLRNRCIPFHFSSYTDEELARIVYRLFKEKDLRVPLIWCREIAEYGRGTPREVKVLAKRLAFLFRVEGVPSDLCEVHEYIRDTLGTDRGGFTQFDRTYLEALEQCGGTAGLQTLITCTNIPKGVILNEIEPFLISKGCIQITSKGRCMTQ